MLLGVYDECDKSIILCMAVCVKHSCIPTQEVFLWFMNSWINLNKNWETCVKVLEKRMRYIYKYINTINIYEWLWELEPV